MKKTDTIFIGGALLGVIIATGGYIFNYRPAPPAPMHVYATNKYGAFLAAHHAVYVNDFDSAQKFVTDMSDTDLAPVRDTIVLTEFLSGKLPANAADFKDESGIAAGLIYDAHLVQTENWAELYARHRNDNAPLTAPLRIWSGIATNHVTDTLKFVNGISGNDAWKSFVRGQIYAETGKPDVAAEHFAKVPADFMNVNDYLYVMAFYNHNNMTKNADLLRTAFTTPPGGMYILGLDVAPQWNDYAGTENALAFGLIQNVSHTQIMMYSDLSLLMLRFAQIVGGENDAINYYLGQYLSNNTGDAGAYFKKISTGSPFEPFAKLKMKNADAVVKSNPLFVPAVLELVAYGVRDNNKRAAIGVLDDALAHKNITSFGRAFFLAKRANVYLTFGDTKSAQKDIHTAADITPMNPDILIIQAKIWVAENRELDTAYEYAMSLVAKNPSDIGAWDTVARIVHKTEGRAAALEILERVADVANSHSAMFENLGDLYTDDDNVNRARDAYLRAIELGDDGQIIVPDVRKKLRNLK